MTSTQDMADLLRAACAGRFKVLIAGDQQQLTAVEGGGGMGMLASELGYVQLAEAVRFEAEWEQQASLGLRGGQIGALGEYDDHGRISGGDPDDVMEAARRAYVGHYLTGTDVTLIAMERGRCRELSRRIRDDLVHLGLVDASREVTLAKGAKAGAGDLIVCRQNDHRVTAGHGTTLANGDVLRIEAIGEDGTLTVRLRGNRGPSGNYRRAERPFRYKDFRTAELGYAVTAHAAQGSTCSVSLAVVTGAEDLQWLYSAMTRGATLNRAFVFTRPRSSADPRPGTRPAPELARHAAAELERQGRSAAGSAAAHSGRPDPRDAVAVLADILQRDGSQQSASAERRKNLADADHLAVLNAMWEGETAGLRAGRYRALVAAALPAGYTISQVDTPAATWLWRTLRTSEAAGFGTAATLQRVIGASSLTGARDLAAVIDARIRRQIGPAIPASVRPWSEQVPACGGDRLRFLTELAAAMDDRKRRLGEFAAQYSPAWAISALGPVPHHPVDRLRWERRASDIGAYRELYAWDHQTEPIGPEPTGDSPEKRAAWHAAHASITRTDEPDLPACSDGSLLHMRATYTTETAWAPPYAMAELRQVRAAALDMQMAIARSEAEANVARADGDQERARRHEALARSAREAVAFYAERAELDERLAADRTSWERLTAGSRRLALLADAELRRRHPGIQVAPLVSAEPDALPDTAPAITDADTAMQHVAEVAARQKLFTQALERRLQMRIPSENPDLEDDGEAWPVPAPADRAAILQPPKAILTPSQHILRQLDGELEREP